MEDQGRKGKGKGKVKGQSQGQGDRKREDKGGLRDKTWTRHDKTRLDVGRISKTRAKMKTTQEIV